MLGVIPFRLSEQVDERLRRARRIASSISLSQETPRNVHDGRLSTLKSSSKSSLGRDTITSH